VYHQYILSMYFINTVGLSAYSLAPHTWPFCRAKACAILHFDIMLHIARSFLLSDLAIYRLKTRRRGSSA
jgi:hypothetical protein